MTGWEVEESDPTTASDGELARRYGALLEQHEEMDADEPFLPQEAWVAQVRTTAARSRPRWLTTWDPDRARVLAVGTLERPAAPSNRHVAPVRIDVLPPFRREGVGTALLRRLLRAAEEDERTLLTTMVDERSAAVEVLPRWGFELRQFGRLSRLLTAEADRALLASWLGDRQGYEPVTLDGRLPDDLLEPWIELEHVMNTAPGDGLGTGDYVVTPARYRAGEAEKRDLGLTTWRLAARHRATGTLAGGTELTFTPSHPDLAWQGITAVRPEHRGHGLGRWLKAGLALRLLDERPEVARVDTWNPRSNHHMVAVNQAMGFDVIRWTSTWEAPTAAVVAALAPRRPRHRDRYGRPPPPG